MSPSQKSKPDITISWQTAEYLAVMLGQVLGRNIVWNNSRRREAAIEELSRAMGAEKMDTSKECF